MAQPRCADRRIRRRARSSKFGLGRFLGVAGFVVRFEPIERGRLRRIESELLTFFGEILALLRIVVETGGFHFVAPAFDFLRRFLFAVCVEPFRHLLVACAVLDLRFEIGALYSLESEERVVERTIEMVFANIARHERAALVDRAPENGVTANPDPRPAWRFLG